eukprot:3690879-Amphidinium_carterae.1
MPKARFNHRSKAPAVGAACQLLRGLEPCKCSAESSERESVTRPKLADKPLTNECVRARPSLNRFDVSMFRDPLQHGYTVHNFSGRAKPR